MINVSQLLHWQIILNCFHNKIFEVHLNLHNRFIIITISSLWHANTTCNLSRILKRMKNQIQCWLLFQSISDIVKCIEYEMTLNVYFIIFPQLKQSFLYRCHLLEISENATHFWVSRYIITSEGKKTKRRHQKKHLAINVDNTEQVATVTYIFFD